MKIRINNFNHNVCARVFNKASLYNIILLLKYNIKAFYVSLLGAGRLKDEGLGLQLPWWSIAHFPKIPNFFLYIDLFRKENQHYIYTGYSK